MDARPYGQSRDEDLAIARKLAVVVDLTGSCRCSSPVTSSIVTLSHGSRSMR